jgi:flagellar biosynthesis protein FlhB
MLDTNTLDYIYMNNIHLVPKLKNFSKKHIHLYITHVQQEEINKIRNTSKRNCINKIISIIGIKRIFTTSTIVDTNKSTNKHGFMGSSIDIYELVDDSNLDILKKFQQSITSNPSSNMADLSILYTAIKKKMDYLITDNTSDFESMLQKMSIFIPNYLQLRRNCDLDYI